MTASARLPGRSGGVLDESGLLGRLAELWSGAAVLEGSGDEPAVEIGPRGARAGARLAVAQAREGRAGRAVRFPGQDALLAPLPVAEFPLVSAISAVLPAVGDVHPATVLDPAGHVRPRLRDGQLVLVVRPGPGGTVVPVEKQHEHACAGH